jgi:PAS domain S-box-containing protein
MTFEPEQTVDLLRAALESSPAGILMVDAGGRIVLVNREVERMFGYTREQMLGASVEMLVPERLREQHVGYRAMFAADPRVRSMGAGRDLYGLRSDGKEVPIEIGLTPVVTDEGVFVLSSIVDISGRKMADERFRVMVESSPNGMLMIDAEGRIVLLNHEIERMFGYPRGALLGSSVDELVPRGLQIPHAQHRAEFFAHLERRAMGTGRDLHGLRADGVEFPVEIGLNPIRTNEGMFVLASVVDISARKQSEEHRRALEDQLRQAQKMEAVGRLAGGVAHDFKNLLAGILGCSSLALRALEKGNPPAELLHEIKNAAERGAALSRQLLDFGRDQPSRSAPFVLGVAVRAAERMLRRAIGEDILVVVEAAPGMETVFGDRTHVEQILMNLAINARDAMPNGGRLRISTYGLDLDRELHLRGMRLQLGRYACLAVADTGVGMDSATLDHLFEPFFTTKDVGKGTGLGLYTVYGIVKQMHGGIDVASEVDRGSTFTIYFPTTDARSLAGTAQVGSWHAPTQAHGGGETILLVEDDRLLRATLRKTLQDRGYQVLVAADPVGALALVAEHAGSIALLLTDVVMPRSSGVDLARELATTHPEIKVLFMSAFPTEVLVREKRVPAGVLTLEKPFEDEALVEAICGALQSARADIVS